MSVFSQNKSVLTFKLVLESASIFDVVNRSPFSLQNHVNESEWFGKEPESCFVVEITQFAPAPINKDRTCHQIGFTISVAYRPLGWISDVSSDGRVRKNGWFAEVRCETADGKLLDARGELAATDAEPVYAIKRVIPMKDFNAFDFGVLVTEE